MQLKNTKNKVKIYFIIFICLIVLIIALIVLLASVKKNKQQEEIFTRVQTYTDPKEFKTIEEVATYLDCQYIKEENSKIKDFVFDIFIKIKYKPYTNNQSNELYYDRLVSYCARVLEYNNFRIIDKYNNITIEVICNEETQKIRNKIINGEENYFSKHNSLLELSNISKIQETNMDIQSNIIQNLISNKWEIYNNEFGTKESTFNKYNIYFDEGIEVKIVNNKVFNIIFTENYKENIANNIKTSSIKEEVIKQLGQPNFKDEQYGIIGYKGKDIYLFFNDRQEISIYRVEKDYDSTNFSAYVDKYLEDKDENSLVNCIKNEYQDFDKYQNNSEGMELTYTLKGIKIQFEKSSGRGVQIYNNYTGNIYKDINLQKIIENQELPNNIFVKNEDLVYENELTRVYELFMLEQSCVNINTDNSDKSESSKFLTISTKIENNAYTIQFISKDKGNPNCEIKENVNYFLWLDDYNFIYSIKNKGIYIYNLEKRRYGTILTGKEEFKLIEYKNNILKYDDKSIGIKI